MVFYDFEVFNYDWLVVFYDLINEKEYTIINDTEAIKSFWAKFKNRLFIGYNSTHYDVYIFKALLLDFSPQEVSDFIVKENKAGYLFSKTFYSVKLYNYDAMTNRNFSLKQLEGLNGYKIKESSVSFDLNRKLNDDEVKEVAAYCRYDVFFTLKVFLNSLSDFKSKLYLIKTFHLSKTDINLSYVRMTSRILKAKRDVYPSEKLKLPNRIVIKDNYDIKQSFLNGEYDIKKDIYGVPHTFGMGGLHGAKKNCKAYGRLMLIDIVSQYPSIIINHNLLSRSVKDISAYKDIYNLRLRLKANKDPNNEPFKLLLNASYGASGDSSSTMYDPHNRLLVCLYAQLYTLDLIETLKDYGELLQTNTDGIILKAHGAHDEKKIINSLDTWSERTKLKVGYNQYTRLYQRDVNNYIIVNDDTHKRKSTGVLRDLDFFYNQTPIIRKACFAYYLDGIKPIQFLNKNNNLMDYQIINRIGHSYEYITHGSKILDVRTVRSFASLRDSDQGLFKKKKSKNTLDKLERTALNSFIDNDDVRDKKTPNYLSKFFYLQEIMKLINKLGSYDIS